MIKTIKIGSTLFLALALVSCASVSVEEEGAEREAQKMPALVYVMDFNTEQGEFNVDRTGPELADFKQNLQELLKLATVDDLSERLIPAVPGTRKDWARTQNAWLIRGEFTTVDQGSRLARSALGFGAGRTQIETRVYVYDLSKNDGVPFLTFSTMGGSGAEPGAVVGLVVSPLEVASRAVSGAMKGLSDDSKRTAREITAELSDYMYRRDWISKDDWIKPKSSGGHDVW